VTCRPCLSARAFPPSLPSAVSRPVGLYVERREGEASPSDTERPGKVETPSWGGRASNSSKSFVGVMRWSTPLLNACVGRARLRCFGAESRVARPPSWLSRRAVGRRGPTDDDRICLKPGVPSGALGSFHVGLLVDRRAAERPPLVTAQVRRGRRCSSVFKLEAERCGFDGRGARLVSRWP